MPDCDGSDDDSEMAIEHPLNFEQQQAEESSPFHPGFDDHDATMHQDQKQDDSQGDFDDEEMDEDDMLMRNAQ
jgi:hypothetical protein